MTHLQRHRLESVSDHSGPSSSSSKSDSSDGSVSEICEVMQDWSLDGSDPQSHPMQLHHPNNLHNPHHHHHHNHHRHQPPPYTQEDVDEQDDDLEYTKHDLISLDNGVITDYERAQVESFFSGLGTEVYVSSSLANLYERVGKEDWRLVFTGIPVLLHDKGSTRSRCTPRVSFVLAERGTCFALWKDTIDNLSDYKVAAAAFHTMCLSADHRKVIGFSFDSNQAAREMWVRVEELTSNPENIALSAPGRKRKTQKRAKPIVLPPKSQISQPCQFNHVTSVTTSDTQRYFSLQAFVSAPVKHRSP
ncbi:AGAP007736-PA [Anopheles gambiae str. PEST]|uniref:AGAP007736-PA n=1 Tax=Anopheles gambiae TaxID=7165 RepID=Q7Q369_ANOGA|nr:AGAP007736-PA [Anopheles gambiae str. PEST]